MIYELMQSRRSVRRFRPEMPERHLVEQLIAAAITAPSASNKQAWRFLAVTNRPIIERLAAAVRQEVDLVARHVETDFEPAFRAYGDYFTRFEAAPLVLVPLYRRLQILSNMVDASLPEGARRAITEMEDRSGIVSAALAMQNLLLMAHSLGLGASGMTGPLLASGAIREILEIQPSWSVVAFIPLGFPAEDPPPTSRKPVDRVLKWVD